MNSPDRYDVVIVGGAFSGAATALLLRREMPSLRVLVVEKLDAFDRTNAVAIAIERGIVHLGE